MNYTELDVEEEENILEARMRVLGALETIGPFTGPLEGELKDYDTVMIDIKRRYRDTMERLVRLIARMTSLQKKIETLRTSIDIFGTHHEYVETFTTLIDQFEKDEQIQELKTEYDETLRQYRDLRHLITFVTDDDINRFMCFTCIEKNIEYAFAPCGHTCCAMCIERLGPRKCPYCRADITQIIKLYLG